MAGNIRSLWTELRAPTHPHVEAVTPNAGFPGGSVSEPSCQCRRCRFNSWVEKIPWIRKCQPTSVFLPGKSHGQRSLPGYLPSMGLQRVGHNLATAAAKSLQLCPTLCDPIDSSPPGSPVPGILQASTLEWVAISFSNAGKWKVKVKSLSRVQLFATPWTAAHQAPPSLGFSRQECWSGLPLPSPQLSD